METLQTIYGVLIIIVLGGANGSSVNQTNSTEQNSTYTIITSHNKDTENFYHEIEDLNSTTFSVNLFGDTNSNSHYNNYKTVSNITIVNNESKHNTSLPSVFDLASYDNTCGKEPEQRACFIQDNTTAELEAELCRQYKYIIQLSYVYSCYENVPGDELINASQTYVNKLTTFLQLQKHLHEYYFQSMNDVKKIAQVVEMADIQAAQGVKAYSLPHSPPYSFQIVPVEIPIRYEEHKVYILEVKKYLFLTANVSNYVKENNLIKIFPYLYEILNNLEQNIQANLEVDLLTLSKLNILLEEYNKFNEGYNIFDIVILGSAGILFFVGIILNTILLAVFLRFKDTRTHTNAMLINLVIIDYISLVFNLLVYYVVDRIFYLEISCSVMAILVVIRHVSYVVSIYSVVILSFQRYQTISMPFSSSKCKLADKTKTIIMTTVVWVFGLVYSLPNFAFLVISEGNCYYVPGKYATTFLHIQFSILCVLPIILVTIFSAAASYKLRKSIKTMPGERMTLKLQIEQRTVSSRVLIGLVFLSLISYLPSNIANYISYYITGDDIISLDNTPSISQYVNGISYNLLYLNSCFNPLIIYFLSRKYRKYFHKIICLFKIQH